MIEAQIAYVLDALRAMERERLATIEVTPAIQEAYNDRVQERMEGTVWTAGGCRSWYLDATGRNTTLWPDASFRFHLSMRRLTSRPTPRHPRPATRRPRRRWRHEPVAAVSPSRARVDALRDVGEALDGEAPDALLALPPAQMRELAAVIREAREDQQAALDQAVERAVRQAPRLLRGPLRKVLVA